MKIHIKPAVLTVLVGIITTSNTDSLANMAFCLLTAVLIHIPQLDGMTCQLSLTKAPPPHDATQLTASTSSSSHDASAAEDIETPDTKSTANHSPRQQQDDKEPAKQLTSEKPLPEEKPSTKSKNKNKKKQKGPKEALVSHKVVADDCKETPMAEQSPIIPTRTNSNSEGEDGGEWTLVSKKRHATKKAPQVNGDSVDVTPVGGERK